MKLQLKPEYLEWSIDSGGRKNKRKLKNVHPSEFESLFLSGYKEFFEVVEDNTSKEVKKSIKNDLKQEKNDDTNRSTGI